MLGHIPPGYLQFARESYIREVGLLGSQEPMAPKRQSICRRSFFQSPYSRGSALGVC